MTRRTRALFLVVSLATADRAHADFRAYDGVKDLRASGGNTTAEHHHNWKAHRAYVRVLDAASGKKLFERPSPALTTLWVSPDGRYVVGLSSIKSANPHQVFILSRDGSYAHQEGVRCSDPRLRGRVCMESVSNVVSWYDEVDPAIELVVTDGRPVELGVNAGRSRVCSGPKGEDMSDAEWKEICPETGRRLRLSLKSE